MLIEQTFMHLLDTYQGTKDLESSTLSFSALQFSSQSGHGKRPHDVEPSLAMLQLSLITVLGRGGHGGSILKNRLLCMFTLDGYLWI